MSATMEKLSSNQVKLTVTLSAEAFESGMNTAYHKLRGRLSVPGFRKGKAPRKVIENYYGQGVLVEEAFNTLLPDAYDKAVEELDIHPVDQPEVDIESIGPGEDCVFTAKVYVRPEVTLGQYFGVEIPKISAEVTDAEVEAELKSAQERVSRWVDVDRPSKMGDRVSIDYLGTVDGVAFEGGKSENFPLVLGSGTFIPGFEEQLEGVSKDEEKDVRVTFPEDYRATELAGKDAVFHVVVHEVKEKEVPELNDEFAGEVSEFETLDEYKADIRKKLTESKEKQAATENENRVVDAVVAGASMEIPEPMVDSQLDNMVSEYARNMQSHGISLEQYMQYTGMTVDKLKEQMRPQAMKRIQTRLVLEAVAKAENIQISDEKVDEEIAKMAEAYKMEPEKLKGYMGEAEIASMKEDLAVQEAVDFLVAEAKLS